MSTTINNMPEEYDTARLPGDVVEAYILDRDDRGEAVRLAVVSYDPAPECPDIRDHGAAWLWVEGPPWWESGGTCDPFDVEDTPAGCVAFAIEERRDGTHFYPAFPGGIRPAGYITPPPGCAASLRHHYAAEVLAMVTTWATGDVYMVDVLERVTWERADGEPGERVTWEPWGEPTAAGFYGIESAREFIAEEYGPEPEGMGLEDNTNPRHDYKPGGSS